MASKSVFDRVKVSLERIGGSVYVYDHPELREKLIVWRYGDAFAAMPFADDILPPTEYIVRDLMWRMRAFLDDEGYTAEF